MNRSVLVVRSRMLKINGLLMISWLRLAEVY